MQRNREECQGLTKDADFSFVTALARRILWLALPLALSAGAPSTAAQSPLFVSTTPPPGLDGLPQDKYGDLVRSGYRIFTNTPKYARRYSGNALSCSNCHLDAGRRPNASPMWAAWGMYPAYLRKSDRVNTFEERVQQCFRFSMNGIAPPLDSPEVRALLAYAQWLATGRPAGVELAGRGFPTIARTGSDPNAFR